MADNHAPPGPPPPPGTVLTPPAAVNPSIPPPAPPPPPPGTTVRSPSIDPPHPGTARPPLVGVDPSIHESQYDTYYYPSVDPSVDVPQSNAVRTIIIKGLPDDVKTREIHNLCCFLWGYEFSNPTRFGRSLKPYAFVTFADHQAAVTAMHMLNERTFDQEKGSVLHVELANSTTRLKRPSGGFGTDDMPGMANSTHSTEVYPSTQSYANNSDHKVKEGATKSNNTPCPTLFVAKLGPNCSEEELKKVFSRCQGFIKVKMQRKYKTPKAFVDFQDTECSTEALRLLQGTILDSSPEGMHLEFARSRLY